MATLLITGYLQKEVTNSKHKSARSASKLIRSIVKKAAGKVSNLEVMVGTIFLALDEEKGLKELQDALQGIEGVDVRIPSEAEFVFTMERARVQAENAKKKEEAQAKSAA